MDYKNTRQLVMTAVQVVLILVLSLAVLNFTASSARAANKGDKAAAGQLTVLTAGDEDGDDVDDSSDENLDDQGDDTQNEGNNGGDDEENVDEDDDESDEDGDIDLSSTDVTIIVAGKDNIVYNGKAKTPKITVMVVDEEETQSYEAGEGFKVTYKNNINAGTATATLTADGEGDFIGTADVTFTIKKAANPLTIKSKTKKKEQSVKFANLKKKSVSIAASKLYKITKKKSASTYTTKDKITYKLLKVTKVKATISKNDKKKFAINKKTGKLTLKKKLSKGTYKVTVLVSAAGDSNYKSKTSKVVLNVKVA